MPISASSFSFSFSEVALKAAFVSSIDEMFSDLFWLATWGLAFSLGLVLLSLAIKPVSGLLLKELGDSLLLIISREDLLLLSTL